MAALAAKYVSVLYTAASLLTSAYIPQLVLPICLRTVTNIDLRLLPHRAIQSSRPHDILFGVNPDVRVSLNHYVRQYHGYCRLYIVTIRETRNERGPRGRYRTGCRR